MMSMFVSNRVFWLVYTPVRKNALLEATKALNSFLFWQC